ncbi:MAG: hypothetical protein Q7R97_00250 [Candidatus Daviesbacteria bacterium]|nr:hypothetical protein [Candidatus Daviesbacteria bacterium]
MVSPELVEELRMIIKEDYFVELQLQEASEMANTLVNFFNLLTKIEFEGDNNQTKGDFLEL